MGSPPSPAGVPPRDTHSPFPQRRQEEASARRKTAQEAGPPPLPPLRFLPQRADAILKPPGCAPEARPPGTVNRWAADGDTPSRALRPHGRPRLSARDPQRLGVRGHTPHTVQPPCCCGGLPLLKPPRPGCQGTTPAPAGGWPGASTGPQSPQKSSSVPPQPPTPPSHTHRLARWPPRRAQHPPPSLAAQKGCGKPGRPAALARPRGSNMSAVSPLPLPPTPQAATIFPGIEGATTRTPQHSRRCPHLPCSPHGAEALGGGQPAAPREAQAWRPSPAGPAAPPSGRALSSHPPGPWHRTDGGLWEGQSGGAVGVRRDACSEEPGGPDAWSRGL